LTESSSGRDAGRGAPPSPVRGRHVSENRLLEALRGPGCALCALRHEAVDRYLDTLLYEHVNDSGLRQALARSRGFCRDHAWMLIGFGDSLGTALLYRDQVAHALRDVQQAAREGRRPGRRLWRGHAASPAAVLRTLRSGAPCPACAIALDAETRYLTLLLAALDDPEMRRALERSSFLCLPHLMRALDLARSADQSTALLEMAEGVLRRLHGELTELIRKRDYRFAHEPRGQEQTSWVRAVAHLVGWWRQPSARGRLTDPDAPL
jgi:hypothetical protein